MKKTFGKIIAAFLPQKEMPWRPQATTTQGNFPCLKRGQNVALIVSPRIGDVIFCTPAIHMLKKFLNPGQVYVIALSRSAAEVFENSPDIDLVHLTEDTRKLPEKIANTDAVLDLYNNKKSHHYLREITKPHYLSPRSRPTIHQSQVATDFVSKLIGSEHDAPEKNYRLYPSEQQKKQRKEYSTTREPHYSRMKSLSDSTLAHTRTQRVRLRYSEKTSSAKNHGARTTI